MQSTDFFTVLSLWASLSSVQFSVSSIETWFSGHYIVLLFEYCSIMQHCSDFLLCRRSLLSFLWFLHSDNKGYLFYCLTPYSSWRLHLNDARSVSSEASAKTFGVLSVKSGAGVTITVCWAEWLVTTIWVNPPPSTHCWDLWWQSQKNILRYNKVRWQPEESGISLRDAVTEQMLVAAGAPSPGIPITKQPRERVIRRNYKTLKASGTSWEDAAGAVSRPWGWQSQFEDLHPAACGSIPSPTEKN